MKIVRANNQGILKEIQKDLVRDPDYGDRLEEMLKVYLMDFPDNIRIFVGIEDNAIKGFIIATAEETKLHVFIVQIHCEAGTGNLSDKLFSRVCLWTDSLGKHKIRAESQRSTRALEKRWNFKLYSSIVEFELPEDFDINYVQSGHNGLVGKETENGQGLKTGHSTSEPDQQGVQTSGEVAGAGTNGGPSGGPVDKGVPWSDDGLADPRVRPDSPTTSELQPATGDRASTGSAE